MKCAVSLYLKSRAKRSHCQIRMQVENRTPLPSVDFPLSLVEIRRLYLSEIAHFRVKWPKRQDGAHGMCRLPTISKAVLIVPTYQPRMQVENPPSYSLSPGRSVTQARRLYVSSLANFRVSDPRYGVANKDVSYRQPSQGWRVWREPRTPFRSLHG